MVMYADDTSGLFTGKAKQKMWAIMGKTHLSSFPIYLKQNKLLLNVNKTWYMYTNIQKNEMI